MNDQLDPLQTLISEDVKAADREQLAKLLTPYVSFEKKSSQMHLTASFLKLESNMDKLELLFLIEKARSLLFESGEKEGLSQIDIIKLDIMPPGSVKSTLKRMFDVKKVRQNASEKYYLPNYRISELFEKYSVKEGVK